MYCKSYSYPNNTNSNILSLEIEQCSIVMSRCVSKSDHGVHRYNIEQERRKKI